MLSCRPALVPPIYPRIVLCNFTQFSRHYQIKLALNLTNYSCSTMRALSTYLIRETTQQKNTRPLFNKLFTFRTHTCMINLSLQIISLPQANKYTRCLIFVHSTDFLFFLHKMLVPLRNKCYLSRISRYYLKSENYSTF